MDIDDDANATTAAVASAVTSFVVVFFSSNLWKFIQLPRYLHKLTHFFALLSFLIVFRSQKTHHKITVAQYRT